MATTIDGATDSMAGGESRARLGSVVALWRYPVKSMLGEELNAAGVGEWGLHGDRAYALVDAADGHVVSAKNPRKWPRLFDYRAALDGEPASDGTLPPVRITLPDGTAVGSAEGDVHRVLSHALARGVTLRAAERHAPAATVGVGFAEEYWPDIEGLDHRDTVTAFDLPAGTFFDAAPVHLLTTATLDRLRALYPAGHFEARRFRPNLVVRTADGVAGFPENDWVGQTVAIGDAVRLRVTGPCLRCVMTTLAQGDLPPDSGILRTAAQHNRARVGVYATVERGGTVRRGDVARLG